MLLEDTIWATLLNRDNAHKIEALRWKIFRRGLELDQAVSQIATRNSDVLANDKQPRTCWTIAKRFGSEDGKSIKLRLESVDGQACESVVLFPRPSRATACLSIRLLWSMVAEPRLSQRFADQRSTYQPLGVSPGRFGNRG
jgi:hypothetical protein